jgi:D-amino-acid oxidase
LKGGKIEQKEIYDLDRLSFDIIVNASGVGAKELVKDDGVYPIRGQIIRIAKPETFSDDIIHIHSGEIFTYIIPRDHDCILGGTYQVGDDNKMPDEAIAQAILERTSAIKPELRKARILEHKVGLRPGRDTVRLEREEHHGKVIIHNYGHGSVGHTLAWGCAEDVVLFAKG